MDFTRPVHIPPIVKNPHRLRADAVLAFGNSRPDGKCDFENQI